MRVGFVGFPFPRHRMMAQRLLDAGYKIHIHDTERDRAASLLESGAEWASSPQNVAQQCSLIFTALALPNEAEQAICGDNGILAGAAPKTILCDMTVCQPTMSKMLAKRSLSHEVNFLDTPVTGGFGDAKVTMFVGGDSEIVERCKIIFELFSNEVFHVGEVGSGAMFKLIHEHIVLSFGLVIDEAIVLGEKAGIPGIRLYALLKASVAAPLVMAPIAAGMDSKLTQMPEKVGTLTATASAMLLAVDMAARLGVEAPLCRAAAEIYRKTLAEGYVDSHLSTLTRYRRNAGLAD